MIFEIYPAGVFQANCYIIGDEASGKCALVDPGGDPVGILRRCSDLGLGIEYILLTHGHGDHIGGVWDIKSATGARIVMNSKDEYLVQGETKRLIPILSRIKLFEPDGFVDEGDIITVGNIEFFVIETPGHTPGGISLKVNDILLTGDTLFQGSIGRTDFEFGSYDEIIKSIREKLFVFPDETRVYPGHGPSTTIGYEKKFNPFLK